MKDPRKILALDPANLCGYAHSDGHRGTVQLPKSRFRLVDFKAFLERAIREWGCEIIAFEEASFGGINQNTKAEHNKLLGVIELIAAEHNIGLIGYKPTSIKLYATGHGNADKSQMIAACKAVLKIHAADDNEADACWILDMAQNRYEPPAKAAKALKKRLVKREKSKAAKRERLF